MSKYQSVLYEESVSSPGTVSPFGHFNFKYPIAGFVSGSICVNYWRRNVGLAALSMMNVPCSLRADADMYAWVLCVALVGLSTTFSAAISLCKILASSVLASFFNYFWALSRPLQRPPPLLDCLSCACWFICGCTEYRSGVLSSNVSSSRMLSCSLFKEVVSPARPISCSEAL